MTEHDNRPTVRPEGVDPPGPVLPERPGSLRTAAVLSHVSENSVLDDPEGRNLVPFVVAGRARYATCSGVAWFRGYHLAVVNLYGGSLRIYRFHSESQSTGGPPRLELLHEMTEGVCFPEDVAVSPDGGLLAITHSMTENFGVSLHPIDAVTLAPDPDIQTLGQGFGFHGVCFSPNAKHLAFTNVCDPGYVQVVDVSSNPPEPTCLLENRHGALKCKSVGFSPDGRFVAMAMALNVKKDGLKGDSGGKLVIHEFDAIRGVIARDPVVELRGSEVALGNVDMLAFLPVSQGTRFCILVANQGFDVVPAFDFDPIAGTLTYSGVFADQLCFPHGLAVSADGEFVAVTNYGDDTLRIFRAGQAASPGGRSSGP